MRWCHVAHAPGRSPPGAAPRRAAGESGQAAVELALVLPIAVLILLGLVQVALVGRDQIALELAAREGARAAAVSAQPTTAARLAVDRVTSLTPVGVSVAVGGDSVTVTVTHDNPTDVAVVGALIASVRQRAQATMALEPPASAAPP